MKKKILTFFLGMLLGCTLIACNAPKEENSTDNKETVDNTVEADNSEKKDSNEEAEGDKPLLDADATDEELLELVKDDINTIMAEKYDEVVTDMKDNLGNYAGQLYQLEGLYTEKDGTSYLTNDLETGNSLPLLYMTDTPEDGSKVRVTGIVNEGEVNGETLTVLEVIAIEPLE